MSDVVDALHQEETPLRFIGLDIHKHYLVAIGVNAEQEQVYGPRTVKLAELEGWIGKDLRSSDTVVLEMTTNTWETVDLLEPHVASVTVVHPPDVRLIVKARVMTDKKAALVLAQLHAARLLPAVWIPPQEVRELRALTAQRRKQVKLKTTARNRLHSLLHRRQIVPPQVKGGIFHRRMRKWWRELPLSEAEHLQAIGDFDTLLFASKQIERVERVLAKWAGADERSALLAQLPGMGLINSMTVLGAIGEIERFPTATKLVGYAGLGASVHDSGQKRSTGKITKAGRRDLRYAMVEAARHAVRFHAHWREQFQRLEVRIGRQKAVVAIARKMLVAVWHILMAESVDRHGSVEQIAAGFFAHAYRIGIANLPKGMSARQYVRTMLDRLDIGEELTRFKWGGKWVNIPPSPAPG